jgi:hypothetical protein
MDPVVISLDGCCDAMAVDVKMFTQMALCATLTIGNMDKVAYGSSK